MWTSYKANTWASQGCKPHRYTQMLSVRTSINTWCWSPKFRGTGRPYSAFRLVSLFSATNSRLEFSPVRAYRKLDSDSCMRTCQYRKYLIKKSKKALYNTMALRKLFSVIKYFEFIDSFSVKSFIRVLTKNS